MHVCQAIDEPKAQPRTQALFCAPSCPEGAQKRAWVRGCLKHDLQTRVDCFSKLIFMLPCYLRLKAQHQVLNYRLINSFARDKNYICVQRKGIIFLKR